MSAEFSSRLAILRRERNITQKNAAKDLGVSQALLSHYENGIRECSLDFLKKAAIYYDVSADYLLSMPERTDREIYVRLHEKAPDDALPVPKTVARSIAMLLPETESTDNNRQSALYRDYFSLCIGKYLSLLTKEEHLVPLYDFAMKSIEKELNTIDQTDVFDIEAEAIKTVSDYAETLVRHKLDKTLSDFTK